MDETVRHAPANADADLIPVRMCNELVYCPRLFHLEHVQGIFVHSSDTIEGSAQHARAKRRGSKQRLPIAKQAGATTEQRKALPQAWRPDSTGEVQNIASTSEATAEGGPSADELLAAVPQRMNIASEIIGVRGEIDLLKIGDGSIVVVEGKHGKAPRGTEHRWEDYTLPHVAWPADVVQVVLYMLLLRELGLPCHEGQIVYRGSNTTTTIAWSPALEHFAHAVVSRAREVAAMPVAPTPLIDSPKCRGCSLHEVCLPDEHHALVAEQAEDGERPLGLRKIVPGRDERAVVHVLSPGTLVQKDGDALLVTPRVGESERFLVKDVSHVALFGPVAITEPCLQHLLRSGITTSHHTAAGWLLGMTMPLGTRNIGIRRAQYRAADDPTQCLEIARALVTAKIRNQRTVLRRHRRGLAVISDETMDDPTDEPTETETDDLANESSDGADEKPDPVRAVALALRRMHHAQRSAERTSDIDALRGYEGEAAARYFDVFAAMLPIAWRDDFNGRSRRPPRDRVNALISFGYSLLVREAVAALARIGLDPMLGLFHTMIPGRPALALDIIEPFRAAWVDTAVLRLVATKGIERKDFHVSAAGVELSAAGRRAMVTAYERRAAELTTHPRFGYRLSYRRLLELEGRILAKVLVGELDRYTPLWTR